MFGYLIFPAIVQVGFISDAGLGLMGGRGLLSLVWEEPHRHGNCGRTPFARQFPGVYAPTLPGYPDSHEKWMHEQFLAAGIAVAGIDAGEAYGSPRGQKLMTALYEKLTKKRGFAVKPCLLGRSRGGL